MSFHIALVGTPNCGKTTLFNWLTGQRQRTGNWAGVTVERKEGRFSWNGKAFLLTDLPGIRSLTAFSMEEEVTRSFLLEESVQNILFVADSSRLERGLPLLFQLAEFGIPIVVALNLADVLEREGKRLDTVSLESMLGLPVQSISARTGAGISELLDKLSRQVDSPAVPKWELFCDGATFRAVSKAEKVFAGEGKAFPRFWAMRAMEGEKKILQSLSQDSREQIRRILHWYASQYPGSSLAWLLPSLRFRRGRELAAQAVRPCAAVPPGRRTSLDDWVLHPVLSYPVLGFATALVFWMVYGVPGNRLRGLAESLFSAAGLMLRNLMAHWELSLWVQAALAALWDAFTSLASFLPQLFLLFFCLGLFEESGYLARCAFLLDSPLKFLGLTGRSFAPIVSGFGCTTGAVFSSRVMERGWERRRVVLLLPFFPCSAKLPLCWLLAGLFFAAHRQLAVGLLYGMGLLLAGLWGLCLRGFSERREEALLMELPEYRLPSLTLLLLRAFRQCALFVKRSGKVVVLTGILVWLASHITPSLFPTWQAENSILALLGRWGGELLAPVGLGDWRIAAALGSGLAAKEAALYDLMVLFTQGDGLSQALREILTPASAAAFLVFYFLYPPCLSALSAMSREIGRGWAAFSFFFQLALAYLAAFLIYSLFSLAL